jgi:hypothetical protein
MHFERQGACFSINALARFPPPEGPGARSKEAEEKSMEVMSLSRHYATLRYRVMAQRDLRHEDVRVSVTVAALASTRDYSPKAVEVRIREALHDFIETDWTFSRMQRAGNTMGFEEIRLKAVARVCPDDIFNLSERAHQASREGLTLTNPAADFSIPPERTAQVLQELRLEVLDEVDRQVGEFRARTGREWMIGDIQYGVQNEDSFAQRTAKGAYRDAEVEFAGGDADGGLSSSERIVLLAAVTLKSGSEVRQ